MYSVTVEELVQRFKLENLTPDISVEGLKITQSDVNRPALQLAGFFDYFDETRLQLIGKVEYTYLQKMSPDERYRCLDKILGFKMPCIVISRGMEAFPCMLELAKGHNVPIYRTKESTSGFLGEANRWLNMKLAPRMSIHGVLVDIYGEGVLITGESGIGKSETALELVRRGHRLVADDVVEIKRVSGETLMGTSPEVIRHFIEVRGIGIVDVKQLYGIESVKDLQSIDLIIKLESWDQKKEYDRLGLGNEYMEILGNQVVCYSIPVRPGRNLAIICETAAINHRQKSMGYNAAEELNNRVMKNLEKNKQK